MSTVHAKTQLSGMSPIYINLLMTTWCSWSRYINTSYTYSCTFPL